MIANPEYGWCNFKLGDFEGTPSYSTDVPIDLLNGFIEYFTKGKSCIWFDEEGAEFTLVLTPYNIYIIEDKEISILHSYPKLNPIELSKELINDIEREFESWSNWLDYHDEEKSKKHEKEIRELITKFKELI